MYYYEVILFWVYNKVFFLYKFYVVDEFFNRNNESFWVFLILIKLLFFKEYFYCNNNCNICMICVICLLKVYVYKSVISKSGNLEVYVVCLNFYGF